jgi:hypothetical protein
VIGASLDANFTPRAFIIQNGVPTDLNTVVPADSPPRLLTACGINSRGEITGFAMEKKHRRVSRLPRDPHRQRQSRPLKSALKNPGAYNGAALLL